MRNIARTTLFRSEEHLRYQVRDIRKKGRERFPTLRGRDLFEGKFYVDSLAGAALFVDEVPDKGNDVE